MKEIYLDNSATTPCLPEVTRVICRVMEEDYGNPSSLHKKGIQAEQYVKDAQKGIAGMIHAKEKEIIFTSGGTESNNLALTGCALANRRRGNRIVTTVIEHPSVTKTVMSLQEQGFEVVRVPCDENGIVLTDELYQAVNEDTILVSVMMVNNEIGTRQPVEEIGSFLKANAPNALFHVDAVQAFGKYPVHIGKIECDLLSVSAHKIHGPKGAGFLYVRTGTKIRPIMSGGGQQKNLRSGTINTPGIAGMYQAAKRTCEGMEEKVSRMRDLKNMLAEGIRQIPDTVINTPDGTIHAPHILNASFTGIRSEVLLHSLEERGIFVSSGSACASHHPQDASALMNIGKPKRITDSAIRFSLSELTTKEQIGKTTEALHELVPLLRRFVRR